MGKKSIIQSQANVDLDHVQVKMRVTFRLDKNEGFADGVTKLIETISYGGQGQFSLERVTAREEYMVKVIDFDEDSSEKENEPSGRIQIAIPLNLCTVNQGLPQLISCIMYASVYSFISEYRVTDVIFPDTYLRSLPRPKYGTTIFQGESNDLKIGLILKPRSIINASIANEFVYKAGIAGIDYIADDELTTDPPEWPFHERVPFVIQLISQIKRETGKDVKYIANISGSYKESMRLASLAKSFGADGVMVNTISMGYDVVQTLAHDKKHKPFIVANVIGRNLMAGGPKYCMSDHIHSFFARISGADAVYTGPFVGSLTSRQQKAHHFAWALTDPLSKGYPAKPSYAVMSGGLAPNNLLENWRIYPGPVMFSIGLGLCNLMEQGVSIDTVFEIIRTVFDAERNGGADRVRHDILELAKKSKQYLETLNKLGWK